MTPFSRLAWRLRRHLLRCYELGLYVLLLAMMLAVALPALSADTPDESVQCGNIQSSAVVITR
jgi:hypothetical protein